MTSTATLNRLEIVRLRSQNLDFSAEQALSRDAGWIARLDELISQNLRSIAWCEIEIAREQIAACA